MANLNLFNRAGKFTAPSDEALAKLDDTGRACIAHIGDASRALDAATDAISANESKLVETRAEIAALDKIVPRQTFNDLAKQMAADTQRRRAGL
jgi:hypothetical protein